MKKLIAGIFATWFLFIGCTAFAETTISPSEKKDAQAKSEAYDFKQFYWGAGKEAVIAVEGEPQYTGQLEGVKATYIGYDVKVIDLDMILAYYFCDDGLYSVRYVLTQTHSNESLYIDDYQNFKTALTKKYGQPSLDNEYWENDSKKKYYKDKMGDALCYGYLTYYTGYATDTTVITMNMGADNYDISMIVYYESLTITPGEADYSDVI